MSNRVTTDDEIAYHLSIMCVPGKPETAVAEMDVDLQLKPNYVGGTIITRKIHKFKQNRMILAPLASVIPGVIKTENYNIVRLIQMNPGEDKLFHYNLQYFKAHGRAEPIRHMLELIGANWSDNRISKEEWNKKL